MISNIFFFFQAEDGIRDLVRSRGLGDVYKRQHVWNTGFFVTTPAYIQRLYRRFSPDLWRQIEIILSLLHI